MWKPKKQPNLGSKPPDSQPSRLNKDNTADLNPAPPRNPSGKIASSTTVKTTTKLLENKNGDLLTKRKRHQATASDQTGKEALSGSSLGKSRSSRSQKTYDQIAFSIESLSSIDSNPEGVISSSPSTSSSRLDLACNPDSNDRPPHKKPCPPPEHEEILGLEATRRNPPSHQDIQLPSGTRKASLEHMEARSQTPAQEIRSTPPSTEKNRYSAQVDLSSQSILQNLPPSTRKVHVRCLDGNISLTKLNPLKLARAIDAVCGPVEGIQHLRTGGLYISCQNLEQVHTMLAAKLLPIAQDLQLPVQITIALNSQTTHGKIYAPELHDEPIENLLELLQPSGVIAVRKLFRDPTKSNVPLFVITFLEKQRPDNIKIGYSSYKVDPYYPNPLRCYNCCRWGHSSTHCRSPQRCSRCGANGHSGLTCKETLRCINCKGTHDALDKKCPIYLHEIEICHYSVDHQVSYPEARKNLSTPALPTSEEPSYRRAQTHKSSPPQPPPPTLSSLTSFPPLTHTQTRHNTQMGKNTAQTQGYSDAAQPGTIGVSLESNCWIPAGQPPPALDRRHGHVSLLQEDLDDMDGQEFSLPPLSPLSPQPSCSQNLHTQSYCTHTRSPLPTPATTLTPPAWFLSLLPLILKLLLATSLSAKIECFTELGSKLQIQPVISSLLTELGLTSLSHTQ